ncbi:Poly [ADP-ribose] polymerase 14 [Chelonia mydas]|uniref:Poly [ADP-ribose] polymerase n=1 Tax=Chelonia mydas TaxID=8469 RepID=M7ANH0_CHEMY|nr:Poly [ADP-ribose] polymerase 14 [Chelonia mydas]
MLGGESSPDSGASMVIQRVLSRRGAPHTCLEICSLPGATGPAAGVVLLTLEAVARAQVASVAICMDLEGACLVEAVAEAIDTFARDRPAAPLSSVSMVAADGALGATFHGACAKRWPPGESWQELLGNVLRAQEKVSTQVVSGSPASQKTDAVVLLVVLETDGLEWCPQEVRALAERALGAAGHSRELQPGNVLTVLGTALPDLHCKVLYLVQLDGEAMQQQGAPEVMRQMVRCCLCSVYGTFLESVSFPLLGAGQTLPAMLEEISCYLEHQPNTWMKLVQIVRPLGLLAPRLVAEDPSTRAEALPFCWPEYPLFLRYVDESAAVRREFKGRLEEAGYGFRACPHCGILTFPAVASPAELHGWEAVFCSVRQHYVVHCEGWEDLLEALAAEQSLVKAFGSIRVYDGEDFVGLVGEMAPFLQRLTVRAFQRQLVSQEYLAEPLPRLVIIKDMWVIIKDMVEKELPDPHVRMELRQGTPAIITFQGPRRQVAEAESRCQQLLRAFQGRALQAPNAPRKPQKVQAGAPEGLELRVVGREPDVGPVKAAVAGFMAQFHDESICNMELVAVCTQALQELSQASRYYLPVSLQRLPGNVLRVRGAWEDVAMAVAAVHARIQAAQRQRVEAEVLYGLGKWQHLAPAGWRPFNVATNQQLETAYAEIEWDGQRSSGTGSGGWDGQRVEINLLKAMGVAPGTGAPIHLRREICLLDRCLASHWEPMGESLVRLVELAEGSEEYREMAEGFKRMAPGYCILHIQRVQNRVLWVSYCWQRHWMEEKNLPGELNERLLYHGTQPENRHSIQEIGLRITCRKVGIYGQGLYFAAEAARLADYAKPDAHGHCFMFQVRVLTGQFTQGKEDMVLPPEKPDGGGRYDSVVNMVSHPSIFVTFFDDLTYPEYLITFRGTRLPLN